MPKPIKEPIQNTTSLPATLTIPFPHCKTEKEGRTTVERLARQEYLRILRAQQPVTLNKGGAPSFRNAVYRACEEIWREKGPRLRNASMSKLVTAVSKRIPEKPRKPSDEAAGRSKRRRAIEQHVRMWTRHGLSFKDIPRQLVRTKEGKEIIRLGCRESLFNHYLEKVLHSGFTMHNDDDRKNLEAADRKARKQIDSIPIDKLVQGFMEARESSSPNPVLFSWLKTSSR